MKTMIIYFAKKYTVDALNDLLTKNKDNVGKICEKIEYWLVKLSLISEYLRRVSSRVSDGNIDDEEVKLSTSEIQKIVKEW